MLSNFRRFRAHLKAYEIITSNEYWYGDGPPDLGESFTAEKIAERHAGVVDISLRAANRAEVNGDRKLAKQYRQLYEKLEGCRRRRRCGSQACLKCARAFQRAKVDAEKRFVKSLKHRNASDFNAISLSTEPQAPRGI
jgi:hypothetical protein